MKSHWIPRSLVFAVIATLVALACTMQDRPSSDEQAVLKAIAVLHPTEGDSARGMVTFVMEEMSVRVTAHVTGLTPGEHGFHIHEFGDCSAADATSAAGHFNPDGVDHGGPMDAVHHVGDLGNIVTDENGNAHLEVTLAGLAFTGPHSILGRAVIVHAQSDDLKSQPTGDAGGRVACGVIGIAAH